MYLAGMEDGVFPSYMTIASDDPEEIEEERRLAYVGITRAKEDLTLCYAKVRMIRGETQRNALSRFVREIPQELLDRRPSGMGALAGRDYDDDFEDDSEDERFPGRGGFGGKSPFGQGSGRYSGEGISFEKTAAPGRNAAGGRPAAILRPKRTAAENKPFIAGGGVGALHAAGIQKGTAAVSGGKPAYDAGDRVRHVKYGEGTVTDLEPGPRDYRVTVDFDGAGQKIMYAAFAKLEKV